MFYVYVYVFMAPLKYFPKLTGTQRNPTKGCKPPEQEHRSGGLRARGTPASFVVDGWGSAMADWRTCEAELLDWKALARAK